MRVSFRAPVPGALIVACVLFSFAAFAGEHGAKPGALGRKAGDYTRQQLREIANRRAAEAGIPAELVRAVIDVESEWNVMLTGAVGEIGLMQIRPETARELGYTGSTEALYDPETNIHWGVTYLAGAYRLASGDLCQTVLKYQAGHEVSRMTNAARNYCSLVRTIMAAN